MVKMLGLGLVKMVYMCVYIFSKLFMSDKRCTVAAFPPPTGIGDPALCGSQPLVPPFPYVDLETRGFAMFLCFLVCILVKIDSR